MASRLDAVRAGMYGVLVGDALGVPYEFQNPEQIGEVVWGTPSHRAKPGTWSDDGSLTLALLDSLCSAGFDTTDQARRFLAWADAGAYTPHGEGKFDIGNATAAAFARLRRGAPASRRARRGGGRRSGQPGQRLAHAHPSHRADRPTR